MNQSATHKPKYKEPIRETEFKKQKLICESPLGPQRDAFYDSEDDAVFSEKLTRSDDTDASYVQFKGLEWDDLDNLTENHKFFDKMDTSNNFLYHSYYTDVKNAKQDKVTQKNLLSPFPSFLKTPIYREPSNAHRYALPTVQSSGERIFLEKSSGKIPKNSPNFEQNDTICFHHYHRERFDNKLCEKHKIQTESELLASRTGPIGCEVAESSGVQTRFNAQPEAPVKFSNETPVNDSTLKRPKSSARESETGKCLDCFRMNVIKNDPARKGTVKPFDSEKELLVHDSYMTKNSLELNQRKPSNENKVREKLVYVVEEEGKEVSQLETDLFSVNEILAIKKDLLELSDFAKKLKKLKEIKKKTEKGKQSALCQCRPVAEVLVDVNRRIAALESRQEELERGSQRSEKKGDTEVESKATDMEKMTSDSPPKSPPVTSKQSAMTSTPSFPKTDLIVSRAEGFSNNSEIVNELMDIRTQLQRLEKRRMTQEVPAETEPLGDTKNDKKKGHAIAVFSSRTYILTPEKYEKKKEAKILNIGNKKVVDSIDLIPPRLKSDRFENGSRINRVNIGTKENVANWLRNVTANPETSSHEFGVFVAAETPAQGLKSPYEGYELRKIDSQTKCRKCAQIKYQEFESQEQKNRATEKEMEKGELDHMVTTKEIPKQSPGPSSRPPLQCQECIMTPSGRILTFTASAIPNTVVNDPPEVCRAPPAPPKDPPRIVRNSFSSSSIPSVMAAKEQVKKLLKGECPAPKKEEANVDISASKSLQELSSTSTTTKVQKTAINTKKKHGEKYNHQSLKDKKHKENKNELVKKEIEKILKKNFDISTTSTVTSTTEKSEYVSHDTDCNARRRRHRSRASSDSGVTVSSSTENESTEESESETESSCEISKKLREKRDREKAWRKKERKEQEAKKKLKKYEYVYGKSRKSKAEKSHKYDKKHKRNKSKSKRKNESYTDEEDDDESYRNKYDVATYCAQKKECNPFAGSKCGKATPPVCRPPPCKTQPCRQPCNPQPCRQPCNPQPCRLLCNPPQTEKRNSCYACATCCKTRCRIGLGLRSCKSEVKSTCSCATPQDECPFVQRPAADGDSCTFRNFFRNLRNLANMNNFARLGYCDKETDNPALPINHMCGDEPLECVFCSKKKKTPKPDCFKTCKCVKIFLQSQTQHQEWPGISPLDCKSPVESASDVSVSSNTGCCCGKQEPQGSSCCCSCSKEKPRKQEPPACDCDVILRKYRRRREKCTCEKCGNIHRRKRKKGRTDSDSEEEKEKKACECEFELQNPIETPPERKKGSIIKGKSKEHPEKSKSSIFQRIAEIPRLKTCQIKRKIRNLKTQVRVDTPKKKETVVHHKDSSPSSSKSQVSATKKKCECDPKWTTLENRLTTLEQDLDNDTKRGRKRRGRNRSDGGRGRRNKDCNCCTCRKRKRRRKKSAEKRRKRRKASASSSEGKKKKKLSCKKFCKHEEKFHKKYGPYTGPFNHPRAHEKLAFMESCEKEKREKRRQLKEAQRKEEEKLKAQQAGVHTFCCTCKDNENPFKAPVECEEEEVCEPTTETPSQVEKSCTSKRRRSILERLSSISSFIRNWKATAKIRDVLSTTYNDHLLDDPSRSSPLPRDKALNCGADTPGFFGKKKNPKKPKEKIDKKEMKEIKEKKKKEKKEKKERGLRERFIKTKPMVKRHT